MPRNAIRAIIRTRLLILELLGTEAAVACWLRAIALAFAPLISCWLRAIALAFAPLISCWLRAIALAFAPLISCWLRPIGLAFAPLMFQPSVAFLLQFHRQILAARAHDASAEKHVNVIRYDIVQQPLIMSYDDDRSIRTAHCVDTVGHNSQRIDIEARVALVENRQSRLKQFQL